MMAQRHEGAAEERSMVYGVELCAGDRSCVAMCVRGRGRGCRNKPIPPHVHLNRSPPGALHHAPTCPRGLEKKRPVTRHKGQGGEARSTLY
jgi:hypothetical protein